MMELGHDGWIGGVGGKAGGLVMLLVAASGAGYSCLGVLVAEVVAGDIVALLLLCTAMSELKWTL
jgi:hypothetical protein